MTDTELVMQKLDEIGVALTEGVTKSVEVGYPVIVKQIHLSALGNIFWVISGFLLIFAACKWYKFVNQNIKKHPDDGDWPFGHFFTAIAAVGSTIIIFNNLWKIIAKLYNTEYYVALKIAEILGK